MDNPNFNSEDHHHHGEDHHHHGGGRNNANGTHRSNGGPSATATAIDLENPPVQAPKKQAGTVKKSYKKVKSGLQGNRVTSKFFPPQGEISTFLTLSLTVIAVFFVARTVLGPIAGPGGTIFALLVLILAALLGGLGVKVLGMGISCMFGIDVRLPPLLGMLLVGIFMKNVPYNIGQFGREECQGNRSVAFGDSLNDFNVNSTDFTDKLMGFDVTLDHHGVLHEPLLTPEQLKSQMFGRESHVHSRKKRSGGGHAEEHIKEKNDDPCRKKYIGHELDPSISRTLRTICLAVILLMAGLELDPVALWNLSGMVVRATFVPCFVEAIAVAVFSNLILGFPWSVGFMLGFVLAAVSPAVIIPSLMNLSERGYGVAKGIPTLVIAACSADDVVAISGFGIFLGITFNKDAPVLDLALHGPIEVAIGLSFGIGWGILAQWIPNQHHRNMVFFRFLILFSGGLIALFGAHLIHYDGAGGLAAIIMAFVAGMRWRKEGWGDHNPVSKTFRKMWIILEPVIFALIGTEIQIDKIDPETLGLGILVLMLALVLRMIGTFFAVSCGNLNTKEKIFMAFAWLPKATVQAALGPIFLDNAIKNGLDEYVPMGEQILTLAVLSILITAPLGAISILALGPKLLTSDKLEAGGLHVEEHEEHDEEEEEEEHH
jgi:NhaP-type Na+/H+ or K+/H+ antiporter